MSEELLDFSTSRKEVTVHIDKQPFILVEASGEAVVFYRNFILERTTLKDGSASKLRGIADAEPEILSRCLFKVDGDERKNVSVGTIKSWPNRIQKALFDRLKDISDLDVDEETVEDLEKKLEKLRQKEEDRGNE